jgi:signal transduction histidine kinase
MQIASRKGISLSLDIADTVTDALNGPSLFIYRIFSILIENAVKFSSNGTIFVTVREESFGELDSRFICSVGDQGIGIPEELREKIFQPFVQADSSRTRHVGGIGLGLAIAKRMVELIGGTICVQENEGPGSTFRFSFHCNLQGAVTAV